MLCFSMNTLSLCVMLLYCVIANYTVTLLYRVNRHDLVANPQVRKEIMDFRVP